MDEKELRKFWVRKLTLYMWAAGYFQNKHPEMREFGVGIELAIRFFGPLTGMRPAEILTPSLELDPAEVSYVLNEILGTKKYLENSRVPDIADEATFEMVEKIFKMAVGKADAIAKELEESQKTMEMEKKMAPAPIVLFPGDKEKTH